MFKSEKKKRGKTTDPRLENEQSIKYCEIGTMYCNNERVKCVIGNEIHFERNVIKLSNIEIDNLMIDIKENAETVQGIVMYNNTFGFFIGDNFCTGEDFNVLFIDKDIYKSLQ